jgi:hypothetical protein
VRRIPSHLLLLVTSLASIVSSACQAGGVGDPCVPEDEYRTSFSGYTATQVNVESRSFQCETRVCLVANFNGRVSCPYGQLGITSSDPKVASQADPNLPANEKCWLPGHKTDGSDQAAWVTAPVPPQIITRPPESAVYCSCRCDGPDTNTRYCECPSGYLCQKLVTDYGVSGGGGQLAGSYCIKDGTQFKEETAHSADCSTAIRGAKRTAGGCGPEQPEGI